MTVESCSFENCNKSAVETGIIGSLEMRFSILTKEEMTGSIGIISEGPGK